MREIKFRAWFELEKKMVESPNLGLQYEGDEEQPFTFAFDKNDLIEQENGEVHEKGTLCFELMQYTGLKDKNGKEIYEGDIMPVNGQNCYVVYNEQYARFCLQMKSGRMFIPSENSEVIGNIYKNPELLEGVK